MSLARFTFWSLFIAAGFFLAVGPTLARLEFSGGSENLVVGTVLEMRRGAPWLIPTLKGQPRTTKPPLTAWLTAAAVSGGTVRDLSDPSQRDHAYRKLAWQTRWPALAAACLMLVATAWLGRVLAGDRAGLIAAVVAGSSIIWLRFGRSNSTDVQLALWVTIANAGFAATLFTPRRWLPSILAGIALGLALMSKGPVGLIQTIVPLALFAGWKRAYLSKAISSLLIALVIAFFIALPWPLYVLTHNREQLASWSREIFRTSEEGFGANPAYTYLAFIPLLIPWSGLLILGIVSAVWEREDRSVFSLMLILVPIVIMLFFKDKADRYLLPMLAPAAVLCAEALLRQRDERYQRAKSLALGFAWLSLVVVALGLPISGIFLKTVDGESWWRPSLVVAAASASMVLLLSGFYRRHRDHNSMFVTAACTMLLMQALFTYGYSKSSSGRSELKPLADAIVATAPADAEVWDYKPANWWSKPPNDLGIYLNRTIRPIESLETVASRPAPQVVVIYVPDNIPLPAVFGNTTFISAVRRNQGEWRAYSLRR